MFSPFQPSTTFSIGFTPKNKRLTRQQGFVSASKSSSKVSRLIDAFEKKSSTSKTPVSQKPKKTTSPYTPKNKKPPTGLSHLTTPLKNIRKLTPMKNLGKVFNKLQTTPKKMSAKVEPTF